MPRLLTASALALAAACVASPAIAQDLHDADVVPFSEEGRIHTGRVDQQQVVPERVFGTDMALFFGFPFTPDPGFNASSGSFPAFTIMQLVITDALRVWQGGDFDTLATYFPGGVETPLQMEVSFGATEVLSPTEADTEVTGIQFAVNSAGGLHVHPDHLLEENAPAGVYLLRFELRNPSAGLEESEPFWLVYRWDVDESEQQAAVQWVRDNLVDPPSGNPADLNGDGVVDGTDLGQLLLAWGACPSPCAADLNNDGVVDGTDLGQLLLAWGN